MRQQRRSRWAVIGGIALLAAGLITGCQAEPSARPTSTPSATPTSSPSGPTPTATAGPSETAEPQAGWEVPGTCEEIYSPAMLAELQSANPPLNDPGVTMLSSENADLLEVIHGGAATLRCSWGQPSEYGLATNVTAIDAAEGSAILAALPQAGYGCEALGEGTVCRIEQKGVTLDDEEYARGEAAYVGAGGLVTTAWINFAPHGYTEDIVATIWG